MATILIADDDELDCDVPAALFQRQGSRMIETTGADRAPRVAS